MFNLKSSSNPQTLITNNYIVASCTFDVLKFELKFERNI